MSLPALSIYVIKIVSILSLNIKSFHAKSDCISLDLSIMQNIENIGFHRDINWLIEATNLDSKAWLDASCNIALKVPIGQGMYVNPDQAEDLRRVGKLDIMIEGDVDVEAPAHEASRHTAYIFLNHSQLPEKILVKLPIHLRYQRSMMGGHGKVVLGTPLFLVHCLESNGIICGQYKKVTAPTSSETFETVREWKNVPYKSYFEKTELYVPIGNLDHYTWVVVISCVIGCAGCIYILSIMSHTDDEREENVK